PLWRARSPLGPAGRRRPRADATARAETSCRAGRRWCRRRYGWALLSRLRIPPVARLSRTGRQAAIVLQTRPPLAENQIMSGLFIRVMETLWRLRARRYEERPGRELWVPVTVPYPPSSSRAGVRRGLGCPDVFSRSPPRLRRPA